MAHSELFHGHHDIPIFEGNVTGGGILFRPACALIFFTMSVAVLAILRGGYGFNSASQPVELAIVAAALVLTGPEQFTARRLLSQINSS